MGEASTNMPSAESLTQVYDAFRQHVSATRDSTEVTFLEILRETHPEFSITITSPPTCDLMGYADAGLAEAVLDTGKAFTITRSYAAPRPRLEKKFGKLNDRIQFGRWIYNWKEYEFIVYEVETTSMLDRPTKCFYVLHPSSEVSQKVHHPAIDALLLAVGKWTTDLHDEIYVFDDGRWQKNKELWKSVQGASWDEVILNPTMKANLMTDMQSFFDSSSLYKKLAVPWKRGIILHGVPGNGKTISIKALINELQKREDPIPSLYVKAFDDQCRGKKNSIHSIFKQARTMAPCLLILEDLDSIVEEKERSYFLNEVDGLESNDGILMVGSTNHLEGLDEAISKRPSRFDRKYHFKLPGLEERIAYCKFWRKKVLGSELVEFPESMCQVIGEMTEGFSFAYLKELFVIALLSIARGGGKNNEENAEEEAKKTVAMATDGGEKEGEKKDEAPKMVVPEVEIPAELKDNLLLKILKIECRMLVEDMSTVKEEDMPSGRKHISGGGKIRPTVIKATAAT